MLSIEGRGLLWRFGSGMLLGRLSRLYLASLIPKSFKIELG